MIPKLLRLKPLLLNPHPSNLSISKVLYLNLNPTVALKKKMILKTRLLTAAQFGPDRGEVAEVEVELEEDLIPTEAVPMKLLKLQSMKVMKVMKVRYPSLMNGPT